ncbi:hypothetical protein IscW_ISCW003721 [Ixodes scapularis]|uniref:Uncharacterized protein n=1 Tax=Ixodes scapularis TaxID=6945 RepID=B7PIE0_IXOSC|nr:hypothetical protein IscW_ISCW003721 [Ixodes scapularis]|eukprot:XP_002404866.1 hypothetical protein IscW_ISCW003721 [Ixodes scapularis]
MRAGGASVGCLEQNVADKKAAARACDVETTAKEDKETTRSEEPPVVNDEQKDNEMRMADGDTLATKRPREWDLDEPKFGVELGPVKPLPSKGDVATGGEN